MNVLSSSLNGMLYELTNEHRVSPGKLEITFIVDYSGTINSYPQGFCIHVSKITPGSTQPTSSHLQPQRLHRAKQQLLNQAQQQQKRHQAQQVPKVQQPVEPLVKQHQSHLTQHTTTA